MAGTSRSAASGTGKGGGVAGTTGPPGGRKNVYLVLEGACGSCASSTVTMKMGIERVLREKFGDVLGEVVQVDSATRGGGGRPRASQWRRPAPRSTACCRR